MLYMIVEHFKNGDAKPIYKRFLEKGRLAPKGINYISSWVDSDLQICFQLMEVEDRNLVDEWISHWADIVEFDVYPVITSDAAAKRIGSEL